MATTILYNQKSTYGGPYCFYTVQYTEKSRSATAVTLGITVQARLQYAASYNGYKLTGILTVGCLLYTSPMLLSRALKSRTFDKSILKLP